MFKYSDSKQTKDEICLNSSLKCFLMVFFFSVMKATLESLMSNKHVVILNQGWGYIAEDDVIQFARFSLQQRKLGIFIIKILKSMHFLP